jgi:transcription antitermination factor NusG
VNQISTAKKDLTRIESMIHRVQIGETRSQTDVSLLLHLENSDLIKITWGGSRPGAGRKPTPAPATQTHLIGPRWYVAEAQPREIHTSCRDIIDKGFEAFLPTDAVRVNTRRPKPGDPKFNIVHKPMFFNFLFVRFDVDHEQWQSIRYADGIKRLFMTSTHRPIPIERGLVERLIETAPERLNLPDNGMPKIKLGGNILVTRGAFAGQIGTVLSCDGFNTTVDLMVLGARRPVRLRRADCTDE